MEGLPKDTPRFCTGCGRQIFGFRAIKLDKEIIVAITMKCRCGVFTNDIKVKVPL